MLPAFGLLHHLGSYITRTFWTSRMRKTSGKQQTVHWLLAVGLKSTTFWSHWDDQMCRLHEGRCLVIHSSSPSSRWFWRWCCFAHCTIPQSAWQGRILAGKWAQTREEGGRGLSWTRWWAPADLLRKETVELDFKWLWRTNLQQTPWIDKS